MDVNASGTLPDTEKVHARPKRLKVADTRELDVRPGRRGRQTKGRKDVGKLAFMLEAPTEIAVHIMSYLKPLDILHLSLVSKEFRSMLASPESNIIWLTARRNVGLPDELPPDFCETAYARFLFVPKCELCNRLVHGKIEMIYLRVKLCRSCMKSKCCDGQYAHDQLCSIRVGENLDMLPSYDVPSAKPGQASKGNRYLKLHVDLLVQKMNELPAEEFRQFLDHRQQLMDQVREETREPLRRWLLHTRQERRDERSILRDLRLKTICDRLQEMGYDRSDIHSQEFTSHPLVARGEPLTERAWTLNGSRFEEIVRDVHAMRLRNERQARIDPILTEIFAEMWSALSTDEEKYSFLPVRDFLELPSVTSITEQATSSTDIRGLFQTYRESVQKDIDEFHQHMQITLTIKLFDWCSDKTSPSRQTSLRTDEDRIRFLQSPLSAWVPASGNEHIRDYYTMFKNGFFGSDNFIEPSEAHEHPTLPWRWRDYYSEIHSVRSVMPAILDEAGLDIQSATFADLDNRVPDWRDEHGAIDYAADVDYYPSDE
ncbi:hypothetical protein CALVIDRAFT_564018 [Calocera viscosa TUFC12733]|uniref:F-box domain-containing protein n=1 Tax=Calocera viscosa (strain TUFC12733) TaxID=1330018 RepID=A0A167LX34_CALVF|nr:hypothetical protein CALVIDRAFT_564018 [Calocera viscosa TUFC12733]